MGDETAELLVRALRDRTSLVSLTLMHATDEALLIRVVEAVTAHNQAHAPIMELRVVYETDSLSPAAGQALTALLATDTLYSLQLSKVQRAARLSVPSPSLFARVGVWFMSCHAHVYAHVYAVCSCVCCMLCFAAEQAVDGGRVPDGPQRRLRQAARPGHGRTH